MSALDDAVAACRDLIVAREAHDEAIRRRDAALWGMVEEGTPKARVAGALQERLAQEKFTAEQIAAMGVSGHNVKATLSRR